jgi:hypothetical protein
MDITPVIHTPIKEDSVGLGVVGIEAKQYALLGPRLEVSLLQLFRKMDNDLAAPYSDVVNTRLDACQQLPRYFGGSSGLQPIVKVGSSCYSIWPKLEVKPTIGQHGPHQLIHSLYHPFGMPCLLMDVRCNELMYHLHWKELSRQGLRLELLGIVCPQGAHQSLGLSLKMQQTLVYQIRHLIPGLETDGEDSIGVFIHHNQVVLLPLSAEDYMRSCHITMNHLQGSGGQAFTGPMVASMHLGQLAAYTVCCMLSIASNGLELPLAQRQTMNHLLADHIAEGPVASMSKPPMKEIKVLHV